TEALAFLMIFASLLAMERSGGLAGALAALAFLTRSQNIVFAAALFVALLIVRRWRSAAAFAVAFLIVILPWFAFLITFIRSLMPLAVLLSGAALSFVLIFVHQRFFLQWLFGYRHGLPFILLVMLALVELIGRGEIAARSIAVTVSIISIATGALTIARTSIWHPHAWPPAEEAQLGQWLM